MVTSTVIANYFSQFFASLSSNNSNAHEIKSRDSSRNLLFPLQAKISNFCSFFRTKDVSRALNEIEYFGVSVAISRFCRRLIWHSVVDCVSVASALKSISVSVSVSAACHTAVLEVVATGTLCMRNELSAYMGQTLGNSSHFAFIVLDFDCRLTNDVFWFSLRHDLLISLSPHCNVVVFLSSFILVYVGSCEVNRKWIPLSFLWKCVCSSETTFYSLSSHTHTHTEMLSVHSTNLS